MMARHSHKPSNWDYQDRLAFIASEFDPVASAIRHTGDQQGWWNADRTWVRTFDRHDPGQAPYGTFLYETCDEPQKLCLVEIFDTCPLDLPPNTVQRPDNKLGYLRLTPFPWDRCLTTLPDVLSRIECSRILRYRPHKRCTLRAVNPVTGQLMFSKVFPDDRGRVIHRESVALWLAATQGELGFDVAKPDHWNAAQRTLWQGCVDGVAVIPRLLENSGPDLAKRMGQACASIARSSLHPALEFGGRDQLARTTRYARDLCNRVPALQDDISKVLAQLKQLHSSVHPRELRPIHGAPHAHQWLDTGSRLGLVDFDRFCMGDPELDAATFLAEMEFEDATRVHIAAMSNAFVNGYENIAGPLNPSLLQAYRAHKYIAKSLKAARRARPDATEGAIRKFRRAQKCVQESAQ